MRYSLCFLAAAAAVTAISIPQNAQEVFQQKPLVDAPEQYLIELAPGEQRWVTEDEKWELRRVSHGSIPYLHYSY